MTALPLPCVCLVVLDGWGLADPGPGNAVSLARTPVFDELWDSYPHTTLTASGRAVGLPEGQMGNSEVGHLNLGAGAVIRQDLTRINDAVLDGVLSENPAIVHALTCSERVHLIGLVSDGGVHSSLGHLQALLELAGRLSVRDLVIHCFTDGRDTPPESGIEHVARLERWCLELWPPGSRGRVRVGSVVGRWYAMDRDRRWERIQVAYDLLVHGRAPHHEETAVQAVQHAYGRGETDEFIAPTTVGDEALIRPWDSVLCFNFRPDRMREIVRALAEPGFGEPPADPDQSAHRGPSARGGVPAGGGSPAEEQLPGWEGRRGIEPVDQLTTLTEYEEEWDYPDRLPPAAPRRHARRGARHRARLAAARRRDREVRARHLLLQRRRRGALRRGTARAGSLRAGRPHLRPLARDERPRGDRPLPGRLARAPGRWVSLLGDQLRQPRHGRPHRRDPRRGARDRDGRRLPARGRSMRCSPPAAPA